MEVAILLITIISLVFTYLYFSYKQKGKTLAANKIKLEKLHNTAFKMNEIDNEDEIYQLIVEATTDILKFTLCTVAIAEAGYFKLKAATQETKTEKIKVTEGIAGKSYQQQKTFLINNLEQNSDAKPADESYKSIISAPLGKVGIFQVVSTKKNRFSQEDVKLVELLLSHALGAIKRIRTQQKIKHISFHDALTGLYNRAYIKEEINRLDTSRQLPISIIMIDVNKLKLVNDAFGHKQGDQLLIKAAEVLKKSCRKEDIIARLGGDEFIIFLPKTTAKKAKKIVKRIKQNSQQVNEIVIPLSMAIGLATKKTVQEDIWDVYKRADKQMYENKLNSRENIEKKILKSLYNKVENTFPKRVEHNFRLQIFAYKLAQKINLSTEKLEALFMLVSLHDIGIAALSKEFLQQNEQEEIIKAHSKLGYQIVSEIKGLRYLAEDILYHHEHWDGSGYPNGLKAKQIPLLARIIAVITTYDVLINGLLINDNKLSEKEAKEKLKEFSGQKLDPKLVKAFLEII